VDAYGDKTGGASLKDAEDRLGPLPPTWRSTSRPDDPVSGIRFFRVPAGRQWADEIGPGVEVIHHGHRYAVAWPSLHPEGRMYGWWNPDRLPTSGPPRVRDLPELPAAWVAEYDRGAVADRPAKADLRASDVGAWLTSLPDGQPCRVVRGVLDEAERALAGPGSRHNIGRNHVLKLVRYGEQGHAGALAGLDTLEAMWLAALTHRPAGHGEWERMVTGAVGMVVENPSEPADRGCCSTPEDDFDPVPHDPEQETPTERARRLFPALDWHVLWADDEVEEWIHKPLLPARRSVAIYSAPKVGKSLLLLEFAVAVSRAEEFLDYTPQRRYRVLYVDFENDPRGDVRSRLQAMGYGPGDLDHLDYLSFPAMAGLDTERGATELLEAVKAYGSEVVVIDTVSRAVAGKENDNDTWLAMYRHTGLALKRAGVAVIRLDHTGKDEAKGTRGGSAKSGDVDAIWKLSRVAADHYRLECEESRMQVPTKSLSLTRHTAPALRHTVNALSATADNDKLLDTMERVSSYLATLPDGHTGAGVNLVKGEISGDNTLIVKALRVLVSRGYVTKETRGQGSFHLNARPFVRGLDEQGRG